MTEKIQEKYEEYMMSLKTKKTVVMRIKSKAKEISSPLTIKVNGTTLQQVKEYKYLGSMISDDIRCMGDVNKQIGMGNTTFWKYKELLKRDVIINLKILDHYVKSAVSCNCEIRTYTNSNAMQSKIDTFQ